MFSKPKRTTPEELAGELAATILDPDARSAAAARIPGRPDPDPVGSREVAFAGIAALKHVISETRAGPIADRMNAVVDVALAQAFAGPYKPRVLARFGPGGLATAGAEAVAGYMAPAYWSRKLRRGRGRPPARQGRVERGSGPPRAGVRRDFHLLGPGDLALELGLSRVSARAALAFTGRATGSPHGREGPGRRGRTAASGIATERDRASPSVFLGELPVRRTIP